MECIVANVDNMQFDIETALDEQYGALPLPFTGMDSMHFRYILIQCVCSYMLTSYSTYLLTTSDLIYTQTGLYFVRNNNHCPVTTAFLFLLSESIAAVCQFYPRGTCVKGASCPFRHVRGDRTIVCKHWLRGLCKKGDQCEFLHEYDMTKMPECYFYSRFSKYPDTTMIIRLLPSAECSTS